MGELNGLIDSATGHLGADARGLTSAYRELQQLQRRRRSRAPGRVRDRLFGLLPGAARLLRRGGEGVAGAPRRLRDATTRPCWRITCPTWHRRVSKRYPRPPLPVPLAAAGFAASRLASVVARTRRSQGTVLAGVRSRGIVWRADVATICCLLSRLRRAVHARVASGDALRAVRYVRGGALCGERVDAKRCAPARRR